MHWKIFSQTAGQNKLRTISLNKNPSKFRNRKETSGEAKQNFDVEKFQIEK